MKQSVCSLPIYFSVKNEVSNKDNRFLEVEIDVLHEGLNLNKSIFSKEVVNENIDTIKNTPILGFIRELPDGEKDFKGHEYIITKTDEDGLTRKYIGSAFGLVPESCNARWIRKMSEDGQERDYLRVDGLLWTKFSDSIDIMMRDIEKPHSMELYPDNIDGYEDEDGNFVFTSFDFDGCCILGSTDDIQPAMISSDIKIKDCEVQFTMSDFVKNIQSELNDKYNTFTKIVNDTTFTKMVKEKNNQGGNRTMPNIHYTQTALECFADISNIVGQYEFMQDRWGDSVPRYYLHDIQDNEVIIVDRKNNYQFYGYPLSFEGDKPVIDFACGGKRKKTRYVDYEETAMIPSGGFEFGKHISDIEDVAFAKIEEANNKVSEAENKVSEFETAKNEIEENYNQIKAEFDEIKPKYDDYVIAEKARIDAEIDAQKDAEIAKYETVLVDCAEFEELKAKKSEMTVKELESECAILYARKNLEQNNFSRTNTNATMTASVISNTNEKEGFVYSERYGFVPVSH